MGKITYRITEDREMPSLKPERAGKMDHLVTWIEDNIRIYQLYLPSEEYSSVKAVEKVREQVSQRARVVGVEGEIEG